MERVDILKVILEQLDSIYTLDDEALKNTCLELNASSDEQLAEILKQLGDFRTGQIQNIYAFKRLNDQENRTKEEEKERNSLDINFDF